MRAFIYDATFRRLTIKWYAAVLQRLEPGSRLLDVGVGTAGSLIANAELIRARQLRVTGIDIDEGYVKAARKKVAEEGLEGQVEILLESVYEFAPDPADPYDAVYFSASFMLLPEPQRALRHVQTLLGPGGRVFFTQTFENKRSPLMEKAKPLLKKVTTIDFGQVTYLDEFEQTLEESGVGIQDVTDLKRGKARTYRLVEGAVDEVSLA